MPERIVTVHRFEELSREGDVAEYEIECSSGTYVRSLIADLGDAYCEELRRTRIGPFTAEEAAGSQPIAAGRGACARRCLRGCESKGRMTMEVTQLPDAQPRPRQVAIGTFDGVHVGHRKVIEGSDTVLTFEPHPVKIIHPEAAPKLIMGFRPSAT